MADQVPPVSTSPIPASPASVTPPVSGVPLSDPNVVQAAASGGSSKGMMWVIVAAFLVVAALVGAGIYMYMMARETNPAFQQVSQNVQESLDSAANDLAGVQDNDVSADFAEVDKELNEL